VLANVYNTTAAQLVQPWNVDDQAKNRITCSWAPAGPNCWMIPMSSSSYWDRFGDYYKKLGAVPPVRWTLISK
jgi:hypothetical protein